MCVNLYPFERTAARRGATEHEVIENIDIGGPTMIRAAAKNFAFTAVVTRPEMYDAVLQELEDAEGQLSLGTRESLAAEAFSYTARYDTAIARWFAEKQEDFPPRDDARVREGHRPRVRREPAPARRLLLAGRRAHARALDGARRSRARTCRSTTCSTSTPGRLLVEEFNVPACAIIKHNNPCGAAIGSAAGEAYERAFACDPQSRLRRRSCASTARSTARSPS